MLHCAFEGCTWTSDYKDPNMPDQLGLWSLEWCLFVHLMDQHRHAFRDLLDEWFETSDEPAGSFSTAPFQCKQSQCSSMSRRQDDLFLTIYSFYIAAVCTKEREGMPVVGIAKDRQVLRPLNDIMSSVSSKICFGCAQIYSTASLWSYMYKPGKWGAHFDHEQNVHWTEHVCSQ